MERKYIMQLPWGAKVSSTDIKYEDGKIVLTAQLEEWRPKDGDICFAETSSRDQKFIIIFGHNDCSLEYNVSRKDKWTLKKENCQWCYSRIRPATEEEKQQLFDALAEQNKRWNAEKKVVEDVRWRAKKGGVYYNIMGFEYSKVFVRSKTEEHLPVCDRDYETGNYFKTEEAARIAGNQMIDILKNSKAE